MNEFEFYATQSPLSALPAEVDLDSLPTDPAAIGAVVPGLLVHWGWAEAYGIGPDELRKDEQQLRSVREFVGRLLEIDPSPLTQAREPINRVACICRHFTLLHVALLRNAGIPARVRCGFGGYFQQGKWLDHYITEWWDGSRWVRDDPQIDSLQAAVIEQGFDPHDQGRGHFLDGAEAWVMTRAGEADPALFGIFDMWGQSYIAGNVLVDFAALNKVELLPWDSAWDLTNGPYEPLPAPSVAFFDELAALVNSGDFAAIRARYESDDALRVPQVIGSFFEGVASTVTLPV